MIYSRIWEILSCHGHTTRTASFGFVLSCFMGVYPGGMDKKKIDSCISHRLQNVHPGKVNYWVNV